MATQTARDGAQSIRRALGVLRILAAAREVGMGLSDIARQTGLTRPTVHRILGVLIGEGIVEQRPRTRRYALGEQIPLLALARPAATPLVTAGLPALGAVVEELGDTGFLTLRTGLDTVCLARRVGRYPIQVLAIDVGDRRPLGISSAGIAMLAELPTAAVRAILAQNRQRLPAYGATPHEALRAVTIARERGYTLRERGLVPGTRALSVTLQYQQNGGGAPMLAALTIAAVVRRMPSQRVEQIVQRLRACATQIKTSLGC